MSKRIAAGTLWFLAAWCAGAWMDYLVGVPVVVGQILGIAAAALVVGDPLGRIWARSAPVSKLPDGADEAADDHYAQAA